MDKSVCLDKFVWLDKNVFCLLFSLNQPSDRQKWLNYPSISIWTCFNQFLWYFNQNQTKKKLLFIKHQKLPFITLFKHQNIIIKLFKYPKRLCLYQLNQNQNKNQKMGKLLFFKPKPKTKKPPTKNPKLSTYNFDSIKLIWQQDK